MIDIDKYEGHTPAPWKALFNHPQVEGSCVVSDEDESNFGYTDGERILGPLWVGELTDDMPDTKLIADAPLLLEEVKQLTEFRDKVLAAFVEMRHNKRSLTYLLYYYGYLNHYSHADYLKGLHPHALGLFELKDEWMEKAQQYLESEEE